MKLTIEDETTLNEARNLRTYRVRNQKDEIVATIWVKVGLYSGTIYRLAGKTEHDRLDAAHKRQAVEKIKSLLGIDEIKEVF